jgi:hypothetical protein
LRVLLEGLAYCAIAEANRAARAGDRERFGHDVASEPPLCVVLASTRYWELCRKRSTQKGAAWIRELERIAREAPAANRRPRCTISRCGLDGSPGWTYGETAPALTVNARPAARRGSRARAA